jgi:hypothetical protein
MSWYQLGVLENSFVVCGAGYGIVILLAVNNGYNKYIPDESMVGEVLAYVQKLFGFKG